MATSITDQAGKKLLKIKYFFAEKYLILSTLVGKLLCKTRIFHDYEFTFASTSEPLKFRAYGMCQREDCWADTTGIVTVENVTDGKLLLKHTEMVRQKNELQANLPRKRV